MPRARQRSHAATALGHALTVAGAGGVLAGALSPWAQVKVFRNIDLSLPGFLFAGGGLCLAVATLILLGARRSPALCFAGALCILGWVSAARRQVPERVKHQVIGAQMALFPVNRLLDQFHAGSIEVGGWSVPDEQLLGPGLAWTAWGGGLLLLGGLLGLSGDPLIVWAGARVVRQRCRACGVYLPTGRDARFCPGCGTSASGAGRRCDTCRTPTAPADCYCINCGEALAD